MKITSDKRPICAALKSEKLKIMNIGWVCTNMLKLHITLLYFEVIFPEFFFSLRIYMRPEENILQNLVSHVVVLVGYGDVMNDGRMLNYWIYQSSWEKLGSLRLWKSLSLVLFAY